MGSHHPWPFIRRYLLQIITAVLAVLLLVFAYHTYSLPLPKPANVLCQSGGTDNWSGWHLTSGWKRLNGMLLNDGSNGGYNGRSTLVAPASCQPKTMDYAVEANIQVVQFTSNYSGFGINMREIQSSSNEQAYSAYIDPTSAGGGGVFVVRGDVLKKASFNPRTKFHVYRG